MWLGIVIGLLLGIATNSPTGALLLGAVGGVIGATLSRALRMAGDDATPSKDAPLVERDLLRELDVLREQLRHADRRIDLLEKHLQQRDIPVATTSLQAVLTKALSEEPSPATKDELPQQRSAPALEFVPQIPEEVLNVLKRSASPPDEASIPPQETVPSGPSVAKPLETPRPTVFSVPHVVPSNATASEKLATSRPLQKQPVEERASYPHDEPIMSEIPTWLSGFISRWITGGNPIVKIGVVILFLGLAFLLRYVAENTIVPIQLRYAGVAAVGIGLLLLGWRLRNREDSYGLILQGAGVAVLYLTTLVCIKLNPDLLQPEVGFAIMIAVAIFATLLAILQDSLALAVAASLGGFAAPVLASTGSEHHVAFFSYLTILNLGIVAIAWFKAWRLLNLIGFGCTTFLAGGWGEKYYRPELFNLVEPFLLLFFALYVLIAFLFARRTLADIPAPSDISFEDHVRQTATKVSYVDGTLVFGVPMATFGLQYLVVRSFENGPAFSALGFGLFYIILAYLMFRRTGTRYMLLSETMIALAVIFGSLAVPLGLEGEWTSAAWAVEAAGIYWVGIRQQRVHARLFALALLFGSAVYFALDLAPGTETVVITGSWLGSLMLAASTWWFYYLMVRTPVESLHAFEQHKRPLLVACGSFFIALIPFLLFQLNWASTALAIVGAVAVFAARLLSERSLIGWGTAYQVLAGGLYLSTLQQADNGNALASGWNGLLSAGLIGIAMLGATWASLNQMQKRDGETDHLSGLLSLGMLGGLAFVNLAPLFVLPWRIAAMVWPITGIATLWWALRVRQVAALIFALGLQLIAGAVSLGSHFSLFDGTPNLSDIKPFLHSGFISPLLISIAAFVVTWLLQRRKDDRSSIMLGWWALAWSTVWWAFAWGAECDRLLPGETVVHCLLGLAIVTAGLWRTLARYGNWPQLGQATLIYLPVLVILLAQQMDAGAGHPLAVWGALTWPLAFAMHALLLYDQKSWLTSKAREPVHVFGAWLFVFAAALEVHWRLAQWGGEHSAWSTLGWLLVPLAYLWGVSSEKLGKKLGEFHNTYAVIAALPIVLFVLGWAWWSTLLGEGAAPLPYIPLLNPLETGQLAVLLGIALWWRSLYEYSLFQKSRGLLVGLISITAFAVVTSMVLRTCHQWGHIPWETSALLHSMVAQTSLSIVWGVIAIALMLIGHSSKVRLVWILGAVLVAVVVSKLFLVELAAHGSLERIVSFIVVGLLLLLVGYFAPLPPKQDAELEKDPEPSAPKEAP
jgi:uncharacterized membrane protein